MSFWKGVFALYLIFLAIFFAATPFFAVLLYRETDFSKSILPVLIEFCLLGAFLVVVLALFEKQTQLNARLRHKETLRTILASLVHWCLTGRAPRSPLEVMADLANLGETVDRIRDEGLANGDLDQLRTYVRKELFIVESLTAVAAQIDPAHLHAWLEITSAMRALAEGTDGQAVLHLLEQVQLFEGLPV